jgi:chromosome segregation ATPase
LRVALSDLRTRFAPIVSADEEARKIKEAAQQEAQVLRADAERAGQILRSDAEVATANATKQVIAAHSEISGARARWAEELSGLQSEKTRLATEYEAGRSLYEKLKAEVVLLEENLEDISFGVYRPHFTFQTSDEYKWALEELWQQEKAMIRNGAAAVSRQIWQVGGSSQAGERMTKQYLKLLLRSFNAECDAAIAKVSWSNLATMSQRIRKSFDALNKLGTVMHMEILEPYRDLKLRELHLTYEQEEKKQEEKEEARRAREQMREEEKVQREFAAAQEEAEKEERAAEKALDKARNDADKLDDEGRALMAERIRELESQLAAAHDQKERVKAQAQLTKCGHVYILSNIGSFGEQMVKIGMTRRLEPRERVAELSDASVPFPFDIHTLIYTDNAPALESELHTQFWENRINLANNRKEFFQVPIAEVEDYLCKRGLKCTFNRLAEAKEYRQTCSDRERAKVALEQTPLPQASVFPAALFSSSS